MELTKVQTLEKIEAALQTADGKVSQAAFNLNTFDRFITGDTYQDLQISACAEADKQASQIKAGVNDLIQARIMVNELIKAERKHLVYLWLLNGKSYPDERDYETPKFVWPFPQMPRPGDRIELHNLILSIDPNVPEALRKGDYYIMQYTFFEIHTGEYVQCLKMIAD